MTTLTAEAIHDIETLRLSNLVCDALDKVDAAIEKTLLNLTNNIRVDHTYKATSYFSDREGCHRSELPVGTFYYQRKTFNRGEGDKVYIVTEGTETKPVNYFPATVNDIPAEHLGEVTEARAAVAAAKAELDQHEVAYTGWTRYQLVTSSAGHVHRDRCCSTLRPTTRLSLVVPLSGSTDTEAIAKLGETLCTVCFPEAPVSGPAKKITKSNAAKLLASLTA